MFVDAIDKAAVIGDLNAGVLAQATIQRRADLGGVVAENRPLYDRWLPRQLRVERSDVLRLLPAGFGEIERVLGAHVVALAGSAIMSAPKGVLACVLWQAVWLAVDFSRMRFFALPVANAETVEAQHQSSAEAPERGGATPTGEPSRAQAQTDSDGDPAPAQSAAKDATPVLEGPATSPSPPAELKRSFSVVQSAGVLAATISVLWLISLGLGQTIMPPSASEDDASIAPDIKELWTPSPWIDRQRTVQAAPAPPETIPANLC